MEVDGNDVKQNTLACREKESLRKGCNSKSIFTKLIVSTVLCEAGCVCDKRELMVSHYDDFLRDVLFCRWG